MKTIATRQLAPEFIEHLDSLTPQELEERYKNGDFLYMSGVVFQMVYYSSSALPSGQSIEVTYWSELYDLEINLDFAKKTTIVQEPGIDWKASGF